MINNNIVGGNEQVFTISNSTAYILPPTAKAGEIVQSSNSLAIIPLILTVSSGYYVPAKQLTAGQLSFVMPAQNVTITL